MANFAIKAGFRRVLAIILDDCGRTVYFNFLLHAVSNHCTPAVAVTATYPGADAQTVQDTVTGLSNRHERIDNLMYNSPASDSRR